SSSAPLTVFAETGASSRARMAATVTVSRVCAVSRRVRDVSDVCAESAAGAAARAARTAKILMSTPYAGMNRIRFHGCDLSVRMDAPRSTTNVLGRSAKRAAEYGGAAASEPKARPRTVQVARHLRLFTRLEEEVS